MTSSTKDTRFVGDIPHHVRQRIANFGDKNIPHDSFAEDIMGRLFLKEVEVFKRERDGKTQARVTYEITVTDDMVNYVRTLHGGCAVSLIDLCSSVALIGLGLIVGKPSSTVSHTLVTTFHAPAPLGVRIEIVNTTVALGNRTLSAMTEIWDITNRRLCVTGMHNKMAPSAPPAAPPGPSPAKL